MGRGGIILMALSLAGCGEAPKPPPTDPGIKAAYRPDPRRGQKVYRAFCGDCHDTGQDGAPMLDDPDDWNVAQFVFPNLLVDHVQRGYLAMPAQDQETGPDRREIADALSYISSRLAAEEE